jgi:carbon-monoxide dehydrogenase large subunit
MADRLIGQEVTRREDLRFLTGAGKYVGDRRLERVAHAVFVRSPHAHALIKRIDRGDAKQRGVVALLAADDLATVGLGDLPGGADIQRPDGSKAPRFGRPLLARDRVRFVGEPVAIAIGDTREDALDAAERVTVEYEPLPAVVTSEDALRAGAPLVWPDLGDNIAYLWRRGDVAAVETALKSARHVVRLSSKVSRVTASSLEPRAAVAESDAAGRLVFYASHQSPHQLRTELAQRVGVAADEFRVVAADVGGSFGMKSGVQQESVLIAWAAKHYGRPVRWISDRSEAFLTDDQARDAGVEAELALDADGHILALKAHFDLNIGAHLSGRSLFLINNIGGVAGVYRIPAISAEIRAVYTNTVPTAPYRGAGRPEATYTIERLIDLAARKLGIDPFELRRRNLIPPEAMPYKTALVFTYDCGEFDANMVAAARLADLDGFPARRKDSERHRKLRGLGISNPIEVAGGPFTRPGKDNARIEVTADGTILLDTGTMSVGQGLETAFSQLVADRLGVPLEQVRFHQGDTDRLSTGRGNGGSSAVCVGGAALSMAVDRVIEKGQRLAAELLEAAAGDIAFADGRFTIVGTDRSVGLIEVARFAQESAQLPAGMAPGLAENAEFSPTAVTFPNGCHICELEIDPETGVVTLDRYSAVEDLGRVINPLLVRGQIHGGVVQGLGQALGEQIVYDRESGQLLTGSFMDYPMPRADDIPEFRLATREVPTKVNPLGAKGVGEAGTVGALAATMNAICDALAPLGITQFDMPATPQRVWAAIAAKKR